MKKLPFKVLIVAVILALYAALSFAVAFDTGPKSYAIGGMLSFASCAGLLMDKRWSQYIVYYTALSMLYKAGFAFLKVGLHETWTLSDPDDGFDAATVLASPFIPLAVFAWCSLTVFHYFDQKRDIYEPPPDK